MKSSIVFSEKKKGDEKGYLFITYVERRGEIVEKKKISLNYSLTRDHFEEYFNKSFNQFRPNKKIDFEDINIKIKIKLEENPFVKKKDKIYSQFLAYMETRKNLKNNYSTQNTYESSSNMFKKFLFYKYKVIDLDFKEIDDDFILEMENYFSNEGLQSSTIRFYFNNYSTVFNNAMKNNVYVGKNPFNEHKVKVSVKPKKILDDFDIIKLLEIKKGDLYFIESRMFLFSLFANGLRCSDMMLMKHENIKKDYIEYFQIKTKIPMKVNYSDKVIFILMDLFDLLGEHKRIEAESKIHKPRIMPYRIARKRLLTQVGNNRVDEDYQSYYGYDIKPNDTESKIIIDELVRVEKNINLHCKVIINRHIKKLDPKELLFKDYVKAECFNDYNKTISMNKLQFDTYKSKFTSYNAKLKRMAKLYKLSIEDITTHVSRFTFTNVLLEISGINLNDIRIALGHTNLATTQKYIQTGFDFKKSDLVNSEINYKFRRK
ncbi:phage integrase SAM-like domain-containing protein [Flavobacterium marginilacus]|uniref:phage integrase SAM-like domain-containing protein n=1 Tax=Flavobacterium marginilacus TaxID=3003256 RepID=UPI00248EC537|nr:phage integrase SAM-like domain-containing protein [Flavobacterium marginilacus]